MGYRPAEDRTRAELAADEVRMAEHRCRDVNRSLERVGVDAWSARYRKADTDAKADLARARMKLIKAMSPPRPAASKPPRAPQTAASAPVDDETARIRDEAALERLWARWCTGRGQR